MKKVAIVITRLDLGGAQEVALETAARLDPAHFDVTLLAGPGGTLNPQAIQSLGHRFVVVPALTHPLAPWSDLRALLWLRRYFIKHQIDVVHTHSSKAGLVGRLAAWLAGTSHIIHTVHGWSFNDFMTGPSFGAYVFIEKILADLTDTLVVVAESCRQKGLLQGVGFADQYVTVRAAVDLKRWKATRRSRLALKAQVPELSAGDLVVGTIANAKPQKDPLTFVRVAAMTIKKEPKARFIYVGDGPLKEQAMQLTREFGIDKRVHFLGWQKDPRLLAAGMDVFLLTSIFEGLPCVFPQVLALGLPVVATQVDGAPEILSEGVNGYLAMPRDVSTLADRVLMLCQQPRLRRAMGTRAKRSVSLDWDYPAMIAGSAAIYTARKR